MEIKRLLQLFVLTLLMMFLSGCAFFDLLWSPPDIVDIVDDTKGKLNILTVGLDPDSLVTGISQKVTITCKLDYEFTIVKVQLDISNLVETKPITLKFLSNSIWSTNFNVNPQTAGNFTLYLTASNDHKKIVTNQVTIEVRDQTAVYVCESSGNDEYVGLVDFPVRTIDKGIAVALQKNLTDIYISGGHYTNTNSYGNVVRLYSVNGMSLSGGWNTNFTIQNTALYPTIVDGLRQIENTVYIYQSSNIVIEGISIKNASNNSTLLGGGITAYHSAVLITNCVISSNQAKDGGGLYFNQSEFTIADSIIEKNTGWFYGGGINIENSTGVIDNSTFRYNLGYTGGGGVYLVDCDDVNIIGSTISYNTNTTNASGTGGLSAGGFYIYDSTSNVTITNCQITGNYSLGDGGAIYLLNSDPLILKNVFTGNIAVGEGGGLALRLGSAPVIISNTFDANNRYHISEIDTATAPLKLSYNVFLNETVLYHDMNGGGNISDAATLNLLDDNGYNPADTIQGNQ